MRDNTGSFKKNKDKTQDTHPDIKGAARIVCPHCKKVSEYWKNAWRKVSEEGEVWYGETYKEREVRDEGAPPGKTKRIDPDDDIPF